MWARMHLPKTGTFSSVCDKKGILPVADLALPCASEQEGFEPSVPVTQYNSLANYRIRPLCHRSSSEEVGFEPTRPVKA